MASSAETRQKLKLQQNQSELKKLKERLAKAKSIRKQNMDQGKKLAAGRVKAIAQMEKDILKLQGKSAAEAQAKFNSVKETLIKQNRKLDKTPRTRIRKNQSNEGASRASLRRFEAKSQLSRQPELDAVGPGPDMKKRSMPKRKESSSPTRNIGTRPEPKGPRDQNLRPLTAEKEKPPRVPNTSSRKKSEFGLDTLADRDKMKRFMKDRFNITVTYDDDEDPGDTASRAKGGLFTRRGALYNKPARKK